MQYICKNETNQRSSEYPQKSKKTQKIKNRSVILHIIPVKRLAGHLSTRVELPPKHQIRPLQHVARNLDVADVCRVVLGVDVVVAENSVGVEEVDKVPLAAFKVFVDARDFFFVDCCLGVFGAFLCPYAPLGLQQLVMPRGYEWQGRTMMTIEASGQALWTSSMTSIYPLKKFSPGISFGWRWSLPPIWMMTRSAGCSAVTSHSSGSPPYISRAREPGSEALCQYQIYQVISLIRRLKQYLSTYCSVGTSAITL